MLPKSLKAILPPLMGRRHLGPALLRLGVARDAQTADIKRAYKTMAKRWHPDKSLVLEDRAKYAASEGFKEL